MIPRFVTVALLVALAGCDEARTPAAGDLGPIERPTAVPAADGPVTTSEPVIVSEKGCGVSLCFSSALFGEPPECSDGAVVGWTWSDHEGDYEETDGTRWGSFLLTGSFDGATFTPTEVLPATAYQPPPEPPFDIPCPEPAGGWRVIDPARTTDDHFATVSKAAARLPGYAITSVNRVDGSPGPRDPLETVVTVYLAADPAEAEKELREAWGGMLCVVEVEYSLDELTRIQQELIGLPGLIKVGSGNRDNQVELTVFHDDGSFQRWVDATYGEGLVVVHSVLQPAA